MILKTINTLTKYYSKTTLIYPFIRFYETWKCVRYYSKNINNIDIIDLLKDLCYACSLFKESDLQFEITKFIFDINSYEDNNIDIYINYNGTELNFFIEGDKLTYRFENGEYYHSGNYANNSFIKANNNPIIDFEIYAMLLHVIHDVLPYIFNLVPKYRYTV